MLESTQGHLVDSHDLDKKKIAQTFRMDSLGYLKHILTWNMHLKMTFYISDEVLGVADFTV